MCTKDYRHLRNRLPRATSQKREGLLMCLLIYLEHVLLNARHIVGAAPDQTGSNLADLGLEILDRRRLKLGRSPSVPALPHPRPAIEDPVYFLADRRRAAIVQFEFLSRLVRGGIQGRLRVFGPDIRLKQKADERALWSWMITTDMR
ncbi:hypothetical protein [Mycobacterium nebraskense]|uniref:hypothetical protein n=1 Tax=Mycobacterium nebraskense TaxID=244292 RepID=UPI0011401CEC|nr:hypothetical protein [Mycobacterium nebraskense]